MFFLDGLWLKRSWGGEVKNASVPVAIGEVQSGYRQRCRDFDGWDAIHLRFHDHRAWRQSLLRSSKPRILKPLGRQTTFAFVDLQRWHGACITES